MQHRRRRQQLRSSQWTRIFGTVSIFSRRHTGWRRIAGLAGVSLALLIAAGVFAGFAGAQHTQAQRHQHLIVAVHQASDVPATGRWLDTADNTAYTAQLQPQANSRLPNAFTFTTSLGEQLAGNLPVFPLADGTFAQGLPQGTAPAVALPRCRQGILQSDTPQPIIYTFVAHISADGLAAFALLSYASARDQQGIASVCAGQQGAGVTTYQMAAGCTLTSCTDLAALLGPSIAQHDNAILAAEQDGSVANWTAVYQLTSRQVTAQYSPAAFAALLNRQVVSVGKITAISAPLTAPVVQFTPEGQAYCAVQQTVKIEHNGRQSTQTLLSYYVVENGAWLFWFTA